MTASAFDVVIVGAGPAGLSAALVLGRMRRRVLVLDTDAPAHAVADEVHGFLAHDGTPPRELRRIGREQLAPYAGVELRPAAAVAARRGPGGSFQLDLEDGATVDGHRLLLAHGMRYGLPAIPGLDALWGTSVFHCPYCHGWEVRDRALAVAGGGDRAVHQALLLTSLSDDVVLLSGGSELPAGELARLEAAGIAVCRDEIVGVAASPAGIAIDLRRGAPLVRHALFVQPVLSLTADLAAALGAELTDSGAVRVDATGETSLAGLFAAGDAATAVQSVAVAAGSGARAAYAINATLALRPAVPAAA